MQRRDFMSGTTLSGLIGLTGAAGCAGAGYPMRAAEGQAALERLDRGLEAARSSAGMTEALGPLGADADRMVRLGLEALVVADVARSIPADAVLPRALEERLREELPVLDRATYHYSTLLAGLSPSGRRRVEDAFAAQPDAPMRVAEWIDSKASEFGVDYESRMKLREVATHVGARARRQSMRAVMDDTVGKVERVMAQKGTPVAFARQRVGNALLAGIWQMIEAPPTPGGGVAQQLDSPEEQEEPPTYLVERPTAPQEENPGGRGDPEIAVGAVMMGSSVVVFGLVTLIGLAAGSVVTGLLVGATVGGTLLIVGLIVLIVGLAQNA